MLGFGLPESVAQPASIALPIVELITAILLIPKSTAWWGAILAFLLLAAFVGGIAYNMSKGRAPDCHCFGQIHSEPAGPSTLIRNGLLGAVALFIILFGTDRWSFSHGNAGASLLGWMGDLSTWEIIATLLFIASHCGGRRHRVHPGPLAGSEWPSSPPSRCTRDRSGKWRAWARCRSGGCRSSGRTGTWLASRHTSAIIQVGGAARRSLDARCGPLERPADDAPVHRSDLRPLQCTLAGCRQVAA